MLTEQFVAAISVPTKPNTAVTKDAGIFVHEHQPLVAQRQVFKKSATGPNGLAVSSSHIFAAQADKAIVHVYSRSKGNQEAVVPFPERIHSIALAAQDAVLLLGTESGRVLAWEVSQEETIAFRDNTANALLKISSGRLVSTSTTHLQPVTCLAVDPASNFFLSGSSDAMIHVWALPLVLSFSPDASRSPIHSLSNHRGPISSIVCGHSWSSANIAVSISGDKSAIVWDYHNGQMLRTYLLPEIPTTMTLDPADRALYIAYIDGSLQTIDFFDEMQRTTPIDVLRDSSTSHRPIQPLTRTRFNVESQQLGEALSLSLSWDGTTLISGHLSGKIASWDVAKRNYLSTMANLPGPVSNLQFLAPTGFCGAIDATFSIQTITKPKQDAASTSTGYGLVPPNYTLNMQFTGQIRSRHLSATEVAMTAKSAFEEALTHPSFPTSMLEESLVELEAWSVSSRSGLVPSAGFLAADHNENAATSSLVEDSELNELKKQVASLQRIQKVTFSQLSELREEKEYFLNQERKRADQAKKQAEKRLGLMNGAKSNNATHDVEMDENDTVSSEPE